MKIETVLISSNIGSEFTSRINKIYEQNKNSEFEIKYSTTCNEYESNITHHALITIKKDCCKKSKSLI